MMSASQHYQKCHTFTSIILQKETLFCMTLVGAGQLADLYKLYYIDHR